MKRSLDSNYEPNLEVPFKRTKIVDAMNLAMEKASSGSHVMGPLDPKFGQRRAFPIVIPTSPIDLNTIPTNVEQYLAQVRAQSEACGVSYGTDDENDESDESDYDSLVYIAPFRHDQSDHIEQHSDILQEFQGKKERYEVFRSTLTDLDAIEFPSTQKQWKKFIWDTSCEPEYIAQIIEEEKDKLLLIYFTKWLSMAPDTNLIAWIWAILTAIGPLESSGLALIRSLGKKAVKQLSMAPDEINLFKLCVIISLKFGQRDLLPTFTLSSQPLTEQ